MSKTSREVQTYNLQLLEQLEVGDLIQFPRGLYSHWAVYIGEGEVAHLAGDGDDGIDGKFDSTHLFTVSGRSFRKAFVKVDRFLEVAGNSKAVRNNRKDKELTPLPADRIVGNALMKLGEVGYNVLYKNCEHFASWCRYGEEKSDQADKVLKGLSVVTVAATAASMVVGLARGAKLISKKDRHN
ncbi:phospholipase A and acyltransferase 3-like [Babylonia areolata]|uniref:phospholipase A and acyltransferase 3-like n=1 Tax=Babylonia areolata TaxID=304850 RepID=UPI003FD4D0E1